MAETLKELTACLVLLEPRGEPYERLGRLCTEALTEFRQFYPPTCAVHEATAPLHSRSRMIRLTREDVSWVIVRSTFATTCAPQFP